MIRRKERKNIRNKKKTTNVTNEICQKSKIIARLFLDSPEERRVRSMFLVTSPRTWTSSGDFEGEDLIRVIAQTISEVYELLLWQFDTVDGEVVRLVFL